MCVRGLREEKNSRVFFSRAKAACDSAPMPVRHIVMFGIKEGTTEAQISTLKTGLAGLKSKIPEIKSFELGFDLKLKGGQSARRSRPVGPTTSCAHTLYRPPALAANPAGKNRSCSWAPTFDTKEAYEVYETHEAHIEVINDCIKPIIEPGTRAAIQYEMEE